MLKLVKCVPPQGGDDDEWNIGVHTGTEGISW